MPYTRSPAAVRPAERSRVRAGTSGARSPGPRPCKPARRPVRQLRRTSRRLAALARQPRCARAVDQTYDRSTRAYAMSSRKLAAWATAVGWVLVLSACSSDARTGGTHPAVAPSATTSVAGLDGHSTHRRHSSLPKTAPSSEGPPRLAATRNPVGPGRGGSSHCGYIAVGPALEQASAFATHGVGCATAKRVATASNGHLAPGTEVYRAIGFTCRGTRASSAGLLQFRCSNRSETIGFVVG